MKGFDLDTIFLKVMGVVELFGGICLFGLCTPKIKNGDKSPFFGVKVTLNGV